MIEPTTLRQADLHDFVIATILNANLGSARKDAQIDTCEVFSAALTDTLLGLGIKCTVSAASFFIEPHHAPEWGHSIVTVCGRYYDSLGQFDHAIVRARLKIHRDVRTRLEIKRDRRGFDPEFERLYKFYVAKLVAATRLMKHPQQSTRTA